MDESDIKVSVVGDSSNIDQTFAKVERGADKMAQAVSKSGTQAGKGMDNVGKGADVAAKGVDRSTKSMIASIQRQTAVLEAGSRTNAKYWETLASQRGVDTSALKPYLDQLDSVRMKQSLTSSALAGGTVAFDKYGISAKQTAAAMRGVPAQMTDIIVSLQGGQRPMTVLLQQGGQLKDMFGGIVPAARAMATGVLAMVNPFTIAAAAIGGIYMAYSAGAREGAAFRSTLLLTGNAAGVTSGQLQNMAVRMDDVVGTQRTASAALNEFARSTKVGSENLEEFATAAIRWEEATGTAVADTVKQFSDLAKDPVKASEKLNESMNYLTTSVYEQIKALAGQGKETEAAALAQQAFADVINSRTPKILEDVGSIESAWRGVKNVIAETIDAAAGIGRPISPQVRIEQLQTEINDRGAGLDLTGRTAALKAQLVGLQDLVKWQGKAASEQERQAEEIRKAIAASAEWGKITEKNLSKTAQQEKDIAKIREVGLATKKTESEIEAQIAAYRAKNADKNTGGVSATVTELAALNARIQAEKEYATQLAATGAVSSKLNEGEKLALQYAEKIKVATNAKTKAKLEELRAMANALGVQQRSNAAAEDFTKEREKSIEAQRKEISAITEKAIKLEDEIATYGIGKSAIEEMEIARLNEQAAILAGISGSEEQIELIQREVKERERLKSALTGKEFLDKQKKDWAEWERDIDQVFNRVGQSLTDSIFEGGKSAKELLKDVFKGLTFNVLINPMMGALQGSVTSSLGRLLGHQNPQQQGGAGGMMQNANSVNSIFGAGYQAMTGASAGASTASLGYANAVGAFGGDSIGALISANGGWEGAMAGFGSAAGGAAAAGTIAGISSLGAGLGASLGATIGTSTAAMATSTFAASVGGATAAAGGAAAGGAAMGGMGAAMGAIGTAMPYIGAAVAIASALGVFDSGPPKTRHSQRTTAELTGGTFGITQRDDRQGAGAAEAAQAMAEASVNAANEIFSKVGVDAAIDSFYAIMESSILGDRNGVASGGALRSGDTTSNIGIGKTSDMTVIGFGGWSEEEMLPRLATDIQLSVLQAFQQKAAELPKVMADMLSGVDIRGLGSEETAALIARFYGVVTEVESFRTALETLPFDSLKALSFDAAAGLIAAAGGLENLTTGLTSYYQNFYSQEEQLALSAKGIETALSGVSLTMPDVTQGATAAKDAFRSLFESLDPATESGAAAIATMLGVNESFAQLVTGMEQLNGVTSQTAAAIAQQRLGLENQLLQLQGNTIELRKRELAAIDVSNHALQESVWAHQDQAEAAQLAAAAQAEAAQLAAGIASERLGLENQLLQLEGNTVELRRRELAALDGSNRGLQEHIWALQDQAAATQAAAQTLQTAYQAVVQAGQAEIARLQKSFGATDSAMSSYRSAVQRLSSEFSSLISTIGQGVADLRGQAEEAARMQYDQARAVIGTALVTRQMPQTADLSEALRIAQQGVTGQVYGSSFEQQKAYLVLANEMEALKGIAQPELDTAQATLAQLENQYALLRGTNGIAGDSLVALEEQLRAALSTEESARTQIAGIESQLELSRLQFEELTGIKSSIDDGFSSLAAALASFASAAVGSVASGAVSSGGDYYTAKLAQLQATGSMHGGIDWTKATTSDLSNYFASIGLTPQEHWDQWGKNEDLKLPGFDVGTARVTHDMNARIHKDEIIIDPRSSDILRRYGIGVQGGGDNETKELLRQIVDRLDRLEGPASRSARSNERLTEMIDQVTEGGNAIRNVNMETVDVRIKA